MTTKLAGLESDLKTRQQKNLSVEKQLEDAKSKVKQLSKGMERKVKDLLTQLNEVSTECSTLKSAKKALEEMHVQLSELSDRCNELVSQKKELSGKEDRGTHRRKLRS